LAIDEAQNLDPDVLEAVRLLSNFETSRDKMLQILLIGQPQLARKLASPELEQLRQRISVFARLEPFGAEETARYIAHRLKVAGYEGGALFTPGALRIVTEQSQGIPRKINSLCFSALSLVCAMGRQQVDVGIMEEVIADSDVESLLRPSISRHVVSAAVTPRPTLTSPVISRHAPLSYQEKPKGSFGRWRMGAASVAACAAIGIGIFSLSPRRIDRSIQESSEVWASIRNAAASIRGLPPLKSDSVPLSSTLNDQAAELPITEAGQSSPSSDDAGAKTVIVQPGDTLRQIILRTTGEYNGDTIEQIRKLNPAMVDLDHLEAGQAIRIPQVSVPVDSAVASERTGVAGKN
jgi:hypothetical protein